DVDPDVRDAAVRESGGNPFRLEQLARGRTDLRRTLDALAPRALTLLQAAAAVGEPIAPRLAAAAAGLTLADAVPAFHALPRRARQRRALARGRAARRSRRPMPRAARPARRRPRRRRRPRGAAPDPARLPAPGAAGRGAARGGARRRPPGRSRGGTSAAARRR